MKHLNDDELKVYAHASFLHRTHGTDASEMKEVQQHLAACVECQERYAPLAFTYSEKLLKIYTRPATSYPPITTDVMWRARNLQPSGLLGWRFASIPIGLILVGIFVLAMGLLVLANKGNNVPRFQSRSQKTNAIVVPTLAKQAGAPFISICHRPNEVALKHMYICGHNYTPGSSVELIITMPDSASTVHKTLMVMKDGTIRYALYIASCKSVPSAITAVNGNHRVELPSAQESIQFGTCPPVSGVVGTPKQ